MKEAFRVFAEKAAYRRHALGFSSRCYHRSSLGRDGPILRLLGHLATRHQYRHDHHHLPDGISHPEQPEPGLAGHGAQAR